MSALGEGLSDKGRAITEAADPRGAAAHLSDRLREAWNADPAMEGFVFATLSRQGL